MGRLKLDEYSRIGEFKKVKTDQDPIRKMITGEKADSKIPTMKRKKYIIPEVLAPACANVNMVQPEHFHKRRLVNILVV